LEEKEKEKSYLFTSIC